jgi:hypothetical protein
VEVSRRTLKVLAAVVWYAGGVALTRKGVSLILESRRQDPESDCLFVALGAALLLGGLKARFLFNSSCRRNLARIAALEHPRVWQFFRPGFFVALAVMIATGALLSRLAYADPRHILRRGRRPYDRRGAARIQLGVLARARVRRGIAGGLSRRRPEMTP